MCTWALTSLSLFETCCQLFYHSRTKIKACCCLYVVITSPHLQLNQTSVCVSSGKQQWKWVSQPYYEFTSGSWHHSDRAEDMRNERSVRVRHEQTRREKSNWMRLRSPLLREQWQRQIEVDLLCASHLQNTVSPSRFAYFLVTFCLCFLFSGHCSCHVLYTLKQSIFI